MSLVKAKVSSVVSKQLPEFVREDNEKFVAFLEAYYEFLDQEQNEKRNLESIRDIDDTLDSFIQYFRNELLLQIPISVLSDKRYLAKQISELYRSKGSVKSYEFLFRILFNETPQLYFPKVDMLRVSDGKYDQRVVLRCNEIEGDSFNLVGQTISQGSTRSVVESVIKFQVGSDIVSEITINENSTVGTFNPNSLITGLDNISGDPITLDLLSILTDVNIGNGGALYSVGSPVSLLSGTGSDAQVEVTNIGYGSVNQIVIDNPGSGYTIGAELSFDNTDAGDINDSLVSARAIITDIDVDSFLMEDGSYLLSETRDQFDIETATTGGIKQVRLLTGGFYYKKLPIVTANGGTGAKLIAIGSDIGRVVKVGITNPGVNYDTPPIAIFPVNIVVKDIVSTFSVGDEITVAEQTLALEENVDEELLLENGDRIVLEAQQTPIGTVYSIDPDRNLITLFPTSDRIVFEKETDDGYLLSEEGLTFVNELSGQFETNQTIVNTTGASAKIISGTGNHAEANGVIGGVGRTLGKFVNADGKISESSKKIQDSFFYQEYSYVIKVGQSIDKYRDAVKKLLHPIGLALFGEVTIQSEVSAPTSVVLEFSELLSIIRSFLNLKMRAVGNYRTEFEDDSTRSKEQITLLYAGLISSVLETKSLPSEFLPTLYLPNLTPTEVYLLDLRVDAPESLKTLLLKMNVVASAEFMQPFMNLQLRSSPSANTRQFGPTLEWLERWKFTIAPYEAGSKNSIGVYRDEWDQSYPAPNVGYWSTYANTQIKDFANIIIGDVINNPNRRTNFAKEAQIDIIKIDIDPTMDTDRVTMDSIGVTMDDFDEVTLLFDSTATTKLDSTSVTMDAM
jgi:hypothetical protein